MFGRKKSLLGIDIGTSSVKAVREGGIKSKRCVSAVSGRSVIHRQVPMMMIPDSELKQAMEYEADKYIPFDVSEVQLDAQRLRDMTISPEENISTGSSTSIPAGGTAQMKVLLVAAKKNLIEEHVNLLQSVG